MPPFAARGVAPPAGTRQVGRAIAFVFFFSFFFFLPCVCLLLLFFFFFLPLTCQNLKN
jgi:hypothetical protein